MNETDAASDDAVGRGALRKASWRLLPLVGLGYGIAYMDRINISFAALQMNQDLHFTATIYGFGGGLFFLAYALCEVPSNLALMRFGARRWIARIMLTWGVLAVGMMFVRTPMQFYVMRFLLGAAEAGFFPGVVFYLMHWFPAHERGRAISRFYVALPLSSVVMGVVAGALLNLKGHFGLGGWQWLFLVEGLPAILLGVAILFLLPDSPAAAKWLSAGEKVWIEGRLAADRTAPGVSADHGALAALMDPRVWLLGLVSTCVLGASYAFNLSAPAVLKGATGLDDTHVGFLVAGVAVLGAVGMIGAGWHSDLRKERHLHLVAFLVVVALGFAAMGLSASPWIAVTGYAVTVVFGNAIQAVVWLIPSDVLRGRSAAAGVAAIGSIGMVGSFVGPWAWGVAKDAAGGFQLGLLSLIVPYLAAAGLVLVVRQMARARAAAALPAGQAAA
jgi:ACS family tartrate transporter-like MFS transporter